LGAVQRAAGEIWRRYELVRDGGRDPDELLAEGVALSKTAIELAPQAEGGGLGPQRKFAPPLASLTS
jgi:hypothetical protein